MKCQSYRPKSRLFGPSWISAKKRMSDELMVQFEEMTAGLKRAQDVIAALEASKQNRNSETAHQENTIVELRTRLSELENELSHKVLPFAVFSNDFCVRQNSVTSQLEASLAVAQLEAQQGERNQLF